MAGKLKKGNRRIFMMLFADGIIAIHEPGQVLVDWVIPVQCCILVKFRKDAPKEMI